jgi:hypothetical protein
MERAQQAAGEPSPEVEASSPAMCGQVVCWRRVMSSQQGRAKISIFLT